MENEELKSLIENYKLSEEEHKNILEKLKEKIFLGKKADSNPSVMFVIGQPGCGKTTFIQNTDLSNYTIINSDDYRQFIKYSDEILEKYPTYYSKLTNYDAHLWGDELFSHGINNGYSVLREKAPVDYTLLEMIEKLSTKNDIIINAVITGNLTSLLATRERYEKELLKSSNAKLSNIESHNKCYDLLPSFIEKCLKLGVKVNYVLPVNNKYRTISVGDDYLDILNKVRQISNENTCLGFKLRIDDIKTAMESRNAPKQQLDELDKIERIYLETLNNRKTKKEESMGEIDFV